MRDFATGYQVTPSARAMHAFWEQYPWVPDMQAMLRTRRLSTLLVSVYRSADWVGATPCYKCGCCLLHWFWEIRSKYDPDAVDLAL